MENVKDIAQIVYYLALSVAGPLALIAYLKARKSDRQDREYKTYDELDNRFFQYQKLALQYYDLDILDVPNNDPSLAFDKKRKQEMVAYAILFSLFERSFLMFFNQSDAFQRRQWSGWKHFLNDFLRRDAVRSAWNLSKETYDTDFQKFMDAKIAEVLPRPAAAVAAPVAALHPAPAPPAVLAAPAVQ
ncbi:MAG: hypothetical protein ACJ8F7_20050 [Gemmataceae bacterium]